MEIDKEKEVSIVLDSNGKTFFYNGKIISHDKYFLQFKDNKLGIILLNKKNVISIK